MDYAPSEYLVELSAFLAGYFIRIGKISKALARGLPRFNKKLTNILLIGTFIAIIREKLDTGVSR